jgi:hypothetical protein
MLVVVAVSTTSVFLIPIEWMPSVLRVSTVDPTGPDRENREVDPIERPIHYVKLLHAVEKQPFVSVPTPDATTTMLYWTCF